MDVRSNNYSLVQYDDFVRSDFSLSAFEMTSKYI